MMPFRSQPPPTSTGTPTVEESIVGALICFDPNDDTHLLLAGMATVITAVFTTFFCLNCRRANSLHDLNETYKRERDVASQRFHRLKRDVIALRRDIHQLQFQETESTISRILSRTHSWVGAPSAPALPSTDSFSTWSSSPRRSLERAPVELEMATMTDSPNASSQAREAAPAKLEVIDEITTPTHVPVSGWPNTIINMDALDDHPEDDDNEAEMIHLTCLKQLEDLHRFNRECQRLSRAICVFDDTFATTRASMARSGDEYTSLIQNAIQDMQFAHNNQ